MNKRPEILSPVGNEAMLTAALRSGADAVYLGTNEFNARRRADNFSKDDLPLVVRRCHEQGVKVYLTLNILIADDEFQRAVSLAVSAYNAGVDGLITADLGLAAFLHSRLPEIPLHASTQMTVYSPSALPILKNLGFVRVVAAREMNRTQLAELTAAADRLDMEVEVFVHGALCMSVSGQCLLSAVLGGRSGNRGLCAGPCRLPFAGGKDNGYALSLKDLSLLPHLKELAAMGVSSFKIEGRMKRPEYVAAATLATADALSDHPDPALSKLLAQVFSRSGFTDGYYVGKVDGSLFGNRTKEDSADASQAYKKLHEAYRHELARIPVTLHITVHANQPVSLTVCDGIHSICVIGDIPQTAIKKALTPEALQNALQKWGGTPYFADGFTYELDNGLALSGASLNALRRKAGEALSEQRCAVPTPLVVKAPEPIVAVKKTVSHMTVRVSRLSQLPSNLAGVREIVFPADGLSEWNKPIEGILPIIELPRLAPEDSLRRLLKTAANRGIRVAVASNLAHVTLICEAGLQPVFGLGTNVFSSFSLQWAQSVGGVGALLSPEMTIQQISSLPDTLPTAVFSYGRLPLMLLKACPGLAAGGCVKCNKQRVLHDRKGIGFPIACHSRYCELLNSTPIWLFDRMSEISADRALVYFTDESPQRVETVLAMARSRQPFDGAYTRGLAYRGVL